VPVAGGTKRKARADATRLRIRYDGNACEPMTTNTVYCGVDYGSRRIGLAIANPEGTIASPLDVVPGDGPVRTVIARIEDAVADYDVDEWVVGLPLNMDGTEGDQARQARQFAAHLERVTGKPVHLWDERLSSSTADEHLAAADLTRAKKKARRDAVAAQVMLQSFLDAK
jgi:putative Holliday junction resolvase